MIENKVVKFLFGLAVFSLIMYAAIFINSESPKEIVMHLTDIQLEVDGRSVYGVCIGVEEGWTLAGIEVQNGKDEIFKYIETQNPEIYKNIHDYKCQFWGISVEGQKRIYCNFFHKDCEAEDWKSEPFIVKDGGMSSDNYF